MGDTLDQFSLPDGMQSAGDPVEGNPFPENAPQHQVWTDATRRAGEELSRFNSRLLKERPTPELGNYADWMIGLIVGKFDIWAKRGVHVVWSDNEVPAYDQWLFNYAQVWLESARKTSPILVHVESLLNELRLRLMERMEYWKAEGRRYVAEQKAHQKTHMEAVDAGWLRIQSKRLEGAKLTDCLRAAYDHHARLFAKAGEPLTEAVLNQKIPVLVFSGAIHYKWIPYPLIRPVGRRVAGNFLEGWYDHSRTNYELVPEQGLTETFGGYKVTKGYEGQFKRILESRIAHWRAEALTREAEGGFCKPEEDQATAGNRDGGANSQPAAVANGGNGTDRPETKAAPPGTGAVLQISGLKRWPDLTLKFTARENLRITVDGKDRGLYTFWQLGFALPLSHRQVKAWDTLLELAEARGEGIPTYIDGRRSDLIRAHIRKINAVLSTIFGLKERPIRSSGGRALPSFKLEPPPRIRDFHECSGSSPEVQVDEETLERLEYDANQSRKRPRGAGPDA